ncbi:MAG: response regulator [Candidatus Caldatribacteriota bacterium]|jgi:DNA-binding response OmpR family regulator|nr:response regulator [Atribacterota bacterium]MDD3031978.1 response regulator [Atribacterota bacterium]MDD3641480.1 response regulator [Atribacterota bacterium]MDD4289210.1 response regulator [Atribacterota bacterium]MDD4765859.1 response regulator [Atribacterota bacterium]
MVKKHILIVDGDITHSERLKRNLETADFIVEAVYKGNDALMLLKKQWVDLIILSITLQGIMNGIQLLQELKENEEYQQIPVIVQSSKVNMEEIVKNIGATMFITKPYNIADFLKQVKEIFQESQKDI